MISKEALEVIEDAIQFALSDIMSELKRQELDKAWKEALEDMGYEVPEGDYFIG
jgi:hypothetical protein